MQLPTEKIRTWFHHHKRDLPFRTQPTPYRVWISEVMLQQTQVSVVIPYFRKWMKRFESVERLAAALEEDVIKLWEGLGYYSRARNLLKGARYIVDHFDGKLPQTRSELESIPGIGSYTAGAILSFAFKQKAVALDGNVIRVLSRFFALEGDIVKPSVIKKIRTILEENLEVEKPYEVMEGLIELGALVCKKKAMCNACPLQNECRSKKLGKVDSLPFKSRKLKIEQIYWDVPIVLNKGSILLKKETKGIMKGLWCFPLVEVGSKVDGEQVDQWGEVKHGFTRFQATLYPKVIHSSKKIEGYEWVKIEQLDSLAFPSGHRRIKEVLVHNYQSRYALEKFQIQPE